MSNPMKYIRDLEAVGFERNQAEAQVQMVLDAIEGDLVTKSDLAIFKEHTDRKFAEQSHWFENRFGAVDNRLNGLESTINRRFTEVEHRFSELELRLIVKLGVLTVTTITVATAMLGWLIQVRQ